MNNKLLFNEFFIEGDNQEISHVLLHIIQPSTPQEEKEKGYFFAVCEINNGNKEDTINLQTMMDMVENDYYETPETHGVNTLEYILEKINKENFVLSKESSGLHCLIGTLKDNNITFSFCGQPEALLFYKNKSDQYQTIDLVSQNEDENADEKLFSQIIQGKISPGDYFFGGTGHIVSCFNHDRIQKIITGGRTTEQSAMHFEKVLSGIKNGYSFGGFIIHFIATPNVVKNYQKIEKEDQKMLYDTEKETAQTLAPNLFKNLNNKVKAIMQKDEEYEEDEVSFTKNEKTDTQTIINRSKHTATNHKKNIPINGYNLKTILGYIWQGVRYLGLGIYWLFFMIAKIIVGIGRFTVMLFIVIVNFKNRRRSIIESWKESWQDNIRKIKSLPLPTKILAIVTIIFAIVFISSLIYLQTEKKRSESNKIYQEYLQTIKNKIDAAESTAIYGDETQSKKLLSETKNLLISFTCKNEDQSECNKFNERIDKLSLKLQKMDILPTDIIVDLNESGYQNYDKILKINSKILIFSEKSPTILVYEMVSKEVKQITLNDQPSINGYVNGTVPKENDYALLIGNDHKTLIFYDPQNNELKKAEISFPKEPSLKTIFVYNRRLYTIDANANQIYRHDNIKNGFAMGKNWLTHNNINIRDAVDMSIDGDLFVLKETGELFKFNQGEQQPINLEIIEPNLSSGNEMWTYTDLKNIYILDTINKRLIIFDKNGKFIRQITSNEFSSPTSMEIDESSNIFYIIDNQIIYQVKLK